MIAQYAALMSHPCVDYKNGSETGLRLDSLFTCDLVLSSLLLSYIIALPWLPQDKKGQSYVFYWHHRQKPMSPVSRVWH